MIQAGGGCARIHSFIVRAKKDRSDQRALLEERWKRTASVEHDDDFNGSGMGGE
jgi:hypothetical protein